MTSDEVLFQYRDFPGYGAYTVPDFFRSDWLNEVGDLRRDVGDDYCFVYMGPKGTWSVYITDVVLLFCGETVMDIFFPPYNRTPFHADVFR